MEHEFAYPKVYPLPRRVIDVTPEVAPGAAVSPSSARRALPRHRSRIEGTRGATVRARTQPVQTPSP
jgi:hypothetical protein